MHQLSIQKIQEEITLENFKRRPNYQIPVLVKIANDIRSHQFPSLRQMPRQHEQKQLRPLKLPPYVPISQQMSTKLTKKIKTNKTNDTDTIDYESSSRQLQQYLEQERKQQLSEKYISRLLECVTKPSLRNQTINSLLSPEIGQSLRMNMTRSHIFGKKRSKSHDLSRILYQDQETLDSEHSKYKQLLLTLK